MTPIGCCDLPTPPSLAPSEGWPAPTDPRVQELLHPLAQIQRVLNASPVDLNALQAILTPQAHLTEPLLRRGRMDLAGMGLEASTIVELTIFLGIERFRELIFEVVLSDYTERWLSPEMAGAFWREAEAVAERAEALARGAGESEPRTAWLAGWIENAGRLPGLAGVEPAVAPLQGWSRWLAAAWELAPTGPRLASFVRLATWMVNESILTEETSRLLATGRSPAREGHRFSPKLTLVR